MIKHICIHPQKVFIQLWINITQLAEVKLGVYVDKEIGTYNIKGQKANKYHTDIHYMDYEIYT